MSSPVRSAGLVTGIAGAALVLGLAAPAWAGLAGLPGFGLGVHGGAFDARDAENAEPFGGVHGRLRLLPSLAIEGALDVRDAEFEDDVRILLVPVQVSALVYLIPAGPVQLYVLGGVGFYFLHVDPEGEPSRTEEELGYHVGAGVDVPFSPSSWVFHVDFRYYALAENVEGRRVRDLEADGWQLRAGLTYYFP